MIFGVDISSFQGPGIPDNKHGRGAPGFVIINVRDPGLGDKARECIARGTPWAVYTWAFPGADQRDNLRWSALTVERAGLPWQSIRYWIDYEDGGVDPSQIAVFYNAADELGVGAGLYTYLFLFPTIPDALVRRGPLWLAYYPGNNDGFYPGGADAAARERGAVIWQFSSNANNPPGLDENAIMDEAWFATWAGGAPPQPPAPEVEMGFIRRASDGHTEYTNGWAFYWDPQGTFEALPATAVDLLPDTIWDEVHANAYARAAQLTSAANPPVDGEGTPIDVEAVVNATHDAWAGAPNANEWPTIEAALRGALT